VWLKVCSWVSTPLNYDNVVECRWTAVKPLIIEPNKYKTAVVKIQYYDDNQIGNKIILKYVTV